MGSIAPSQCKVSIRDALTRLPGASGAPFREVFSHGSLAVEVFAPRGIDSQQPHARDEIYVVVQGYGTFIHDSERQQIGPGDFLFVPAGVPHHFEDFTDLVVWVFFYGPQGGEERYIDGTEA